MRRVKKICIQCADKAKKVLARPMPRPKDKDVGFSIKELVEVMNRTTFASRCLRCSQGKDKIPEDCPYVTELTIHQNRR
jgi:hypothetical protein